MAATVSSCSRTIAAIGAARAVEFGAYVLHEGAMRDALVAAARRGADVRVTLQRDPYADDGDEAPANAAAAALLRAAGAHVTLLAREAVPFHCKAAVCDGVAFLDDRNWPRDGGLVLRDDDARDVALVESALRGEGGDDGVLATRKDDALAREVALIDATPAATPLVVASEAFGPGQVAQALMRRAARGGTTTLLIDEHELDAERRRAVDALARAGVRIRNDDAGEKFVLAGDRAWIGSANATYAGGERADQIEWALVTAVPEVLDAVRAAAAGSARTARAGPASGRSRPASGAVPCSRGAPPDPSSGWLSSRRAAAARSS